MQAKFLFLFALLFVSAMASSHEQYLRESRGIRERRGRKLETPPKTATRPPSRKSFFRFDRLSTSSHFTILLALTVSCFSCSHSLQPLMTTTILRNLRAERASPRMIMSAVEAALALQSSLPNLPRNRTRVEVRARARAKRAIKGLSFLGVLFYSPL